MVYKEKDIVYDNGNIWVAKDTKQKLYIVFRGTLTHSISDSAYSMDEDGLQLAKWRANYLARGHHRKTEVLQ